MFRTHQVLVPLCLSLPQNLVVFVHYIIPSLSVFGYNKRVHITISNAFYTFWMIYQIYEFFGNKELYMAIWDAGEKA